MTDARVTHVVAEEDHQGDVIDARVTQVIVEEDHQGSSIDARVTQVVVEEDHQGSVIDARLTQVIVEYDWTATGEPLVGRLTNRTQVYGELTVSGGAEQAAIASGNTQVRGEIVVVDSVGDTKITQTYLETDARNDAPDALISQVYLEVDAIIDWEGWGIPT